MKNIILYILLLVITKGYAQELNVPVFTQYLADNDFVVSPTYAGIGDNFRIRANGLTQWVGIENAPDNQSLYADFRIADRSGVGISLYNDSNGFTRQKGAKFSFAQHLILDYKSKQYLSLGLSYNINGFRIETENFNGGGDPNGAPNGLDPFVLMNGDRAITNNNFDVGALYRYKDFYLSLNANNILPKDIDNFSGIEPNLLLNFQAYTGYVIKSKYRKNVQLEPSIFYQLFGSDGRSSTDINFKYRKYNRKEDYYWLGVSYRYLNDQFFKPLNLGPMAGIMKSKFYFAYAYQFTINGLSSYNSGTHMITIGFDFLQGISNCPCTKSRVTR